MRRSNGILPTFGAVLGAVFFVACSRRVELRPPLVADRPAVGGEHSVAPDVCAHLRGGPAGTASPASDLGRAHALVRYFGVDGDARMADARLVDALDTNVPSAAAAVIAYGRHDRGTCVVAAEPIALGAASISLESGIAVITPGSGALPAIPAGATALAIDVRALPETTDAREAALRVLAAALHGEVVLARIEERICNGQPDEVNRFVARDAEQYACTLHVREYRVSGRAHGLPLAILTAPRLTPLAAWVAIAARASVGAFVVGDDVPTALAESRWVGVGELGVAVRAGRLVADDGAPLPDIVRADYRAVDPHMALHDVEWRSARPPLRGLAVRPPIAGSVRPGAWTTPSSRAGDGRAAILTAYAATRTFFPYTGEIDDVLDARLEESLAILEGGPEADRSTVRKALRRFSEALRDGHAWVYDDRKMALPGAPVALLPVDDALVVAVSSSTSAKPGDVVLRVGGTSAAAWVEEATKYASGSVHAVRAGIAERLVQAGSPIEIRRNGVTQTITVPPGSPSATTRGIFERRAGPLRDLGAPDVYYLSLDAGSPNGPSERNLPEIKAAMVGKRGVILDLRGYPSRAAWAVLAHVASQDSRGPKMAELVVTPLSREVGPFAPLQELRMWTSEKQGYDGPVIVLTGENAIAGRTLAELLSQREARQGRRRTDERRERHHHRRTATRRLRSDVHGHARSTHRWISFSRDRPHSRHRGRADARRHTARQRYGAPPSARRTESGAPVIAHRALTGRFPCARREVMGVAKSASSTDCPSSPATEAPTKARSADTACADRPPKAVAHFMRRRPRSAQHEDLVSIRDSSVDGIVDMARSRPCRIDLRESHRWVI